MQSPEKVKNECTPPILVIAAENMARRREIVHLWRVSRCTHGSFNPPGLVGRPSLVFRPHRNQHWPVNSLHLDAPASRNGNAIDQPRTYREVHSPFVIRPASAVPLVPGLGNWSRTGSPRTDPASWLAPTPVPGTVVDVAGRMCDQRRRLFFSARVQCSDNHCEFAPARKAVHRHLPVAPLLLPEPGDGVGHDRDVHVSQGLPRPHQSPLAVEIAEQENGEALRRQDIGLWLDQKRRPAFASVQHEDRGTFAFADGIRQQEARAGKRMRRTQNRVLLPKTGHREYDG